MAGSLRINIHIDPELFPDIYEDYMRLKKKRKRVDSSRILHLATIGLMMTRQNGGEPPLSVPTPAETRFPDTTVEVVSKPVLDATVELITDDEAEDLENILSGNFS